MSCVDDVTGTVGYLDATTGDLEGRLAPQRGQQVPLGHAPKLLDVQKAAGWAGCEHGGRQQELGGEKAPPQHDENAIVDGW